MAGSIDEKGPSSLTGFKIMFKKMTVPLFFAWIITALLNIMFGYDTTSFGGVQSIPAFEREFGTPTGEDGAYVLSPARASYMSSLAFVGKFLGALLGSVFIEPLGHRISIWIVCLISFVGIIIECTATTVAQFVVGRIIVYYSVGFAEMCATTYQSEIVPASMRGAVVGSIQLFNQIGQITAAGVNRRYSRTVAPEGWIVPVGVQAICPVIVAVGIFFIPDGPRWLISKGRDQDAVKTLERVRPKKDVAAGHCTAEIEAIRVAVENPEKGPWMDLFRGTNLRRTSIATVIYIFQQFTGQAFVSNYSPRFYQSVGLGEHAFDYNIASATVGWVGVACGMPFIDIAGRRLVLMIGCTGQAIFLFIVAGVGLPAEPNRHEANMLVASVILYNFFYAGTIASISYVIGAEIGSYALREKTQAFALSISIIAAFVTAFSIPYVIAEIDANIGWVFGGFATMATIYTYFCVPETKGRSLEEVDELFERRIPARKFASTRTSGAGRRVAELESDIAGLGTKKGASTGVEYHDDKV
ncbi:uncharacterized protein LTR77_004616 [Saxophila tyrrhenica]|uniref:Major facilitator superfamily (MFS) profile domain-containing protein n=1 Tax=Saxophila tyrrhenica TaxID=1690608 RepID=A0AAV9PE09_9PEZI|nr:hypothetical protein LTR77_004616 [Saxophila tyrrhenica]